MVKLLYLLNDSWLQQKAWSETPTHEREDARTTTNKGSFGWNRVKKWSTEPNMALPGLLFATEFCLL